jgi:uncharacterized protein
VDALQSDLDYGAELHRWFDYWLKGIDNGIIKEPPVHYYLMEGEKKKAWQMTNPWPLKDLKMNRFYFRERVTGGTTSTNDGNLTPSSLTITEAFDAYKVNYTTTSGKNPRWTAVNWPRDCPNMSSNDAKALTYTTPLLKTAIQIIGHSVVQLWLRTDSPDLDIFAYLEEVDENGNPTYITEGNLRASHRRLGPAPYDNLGLPFHSYFKTDQEPIPSGKPIALVFDLLPTAYRFSPGKRLRLTVALADAYAFDTTVIDPAPNLQVLREKNHSSWIQLPVVR